MTTETAAKTEVADDPFAGFVQEEFKEGVLVAPAERPTLTLLKPDKQDGSPADADDKPAAKDAKPAAKADDDDGVETPEAPPEGESAEDKEFREKVEAAAKKMAQKRIGQLTKANRTLERDLATRPTAGTPAPVSATPIPVPEVPVKPKAEDFEFGAVDEAYQEAYYEYRDALKARDAAVKAETERSTRHAEAAASETQEFQAKLKTLVDGGDEDFQTKVYDTAMADKWPLSETVARLAVDSDVGREVLAHLAANVDEAKEIHALPPLRQAARFGKIEDKIVAAKAAKPVPKPSAAPAPVEQTRGAGGTFTAAHDTSDFAAFEKAAASALNKG